MNEIYQKTINNKIAFEGVGLHSGNASKITILPGNVDQGIIFKRVDLKEKNLVHACHENVSSARLCTTLENKYSVKVSTVEHLLAALFIAGIDNAIIEIDNEEVPIMDGSAKIFLDVLKKTETRTQAKKRKYLKILNKVELIDGERKISIEPNNSTFEVDFQLNYENKIIGKQKNKIDFQNDNLDDVVESRTFCLFEDIEKIKKLGLAKGGSLDNAVVVDKDKIINSEGLRNDREFVNHKILDLAGDFVLSGYRILGKVTCYQGGHQLSNSFLKKLFESKSSMIEVSINDELISNHSERNQATKLAAIA
jgi:UDP-3-O-[3-hydroxymyristoyl] N-acetylglucosamine deacetylase